MDSRSISFWIVAIVLPVAVAAGLIGWWMTPPPSPILIFERTAANLGITADRRKELSDALQSAFRDLEEVPCDEGLRERAGAAAVAYYETLLERPLLVANLGMTYESLCQPKLDKNAHPLEPLLNRRGLGMNLKLPWSCMPVTWRPPVERALQTRLEGYLASGRIPADAFTGTLALIATPLKRSPLRHECQSSSSGGSGYRRPLPVEAAPRDDWDRIPKRRR